MKIPILGLEIFSQKGLKDRINTEAQKFYSGSNPSGYSWGGGFNAPSTFLDVIQAGKDGLNFDTDPRMLLNTYRAIIWALPYFKTAMTIHQDMTGCPVIVSDDKVLEKELNERWDMMNVATYRNDIYKIQKGADAFKNRLMGSTDSQGIGFAQIARDESGNPVGTTHYNPELFSIKDYANYFRFCYQSPMGQREIEKSNDFFIHVSRVSDKFNWGLPICYGAEYFATLIVSMMESRMSYEAMFGNPLIQNFISNKESTEDYNKTAWKETERILAQYNTDIQSAIRAQLKYRKSSIMNTALPGNLEITSRTMGEGMTGSTNVPQLIKDWTEIVVLCTECPGSFLGMASSAGIGSDKFRIEKGFLMNRAKQNRYNLEPHIKSCLLYTSDAADE